ncbi:MAG: ABC transporter permease, partial [Planctomycetes bacterium]|nr:ABC transporter permease [Planctomycetota bacterium]
MKTLDRKLCREVYRSKWLLLTIASIVAIGVMCFVAMQSAYRNLQQAQHRYYRQCRMADFWIDLKKVPLSELEAVRQIPGVIEAQPRIQFSAVVDLDGVSEPLNGLVLSLPDHHRSTINGVVLRKGDYFSGHRDNQVIVNDAFARKHNLRPGQWIHLLLNNRRQELFIVGTAISSEFTYLLGPGSIVPDPERFGVFYIKQTFAEDVFDFQGAANQIVGRVSPEIDENMEEIFQHIEIRLEAYGVINTTPLQRQASNQFLSAEIEGLGAFATVVPTIFLIVAALVLNVLITRLARQQRVVVGTLKAMGYTNGQVFAHFLKFGLSVGIVGGILGSLLGYLTSTGMTVVYRRFFEFPELKSGFYWHIHAIGISVSLFCALAGSVSGARGVIRLRPAEAMRPEPPPRGGAILLERITWLWSRLTSSWRMALRTIFRHRFRTGAGIFAAMMGAALLITGFMLTEAQSYFLEFQFQRVMRSDIDLAFKDERGRDALDEVRRLPGVERAEPVFDVGGTFVHGRFRRKGAVTGLIPNSTLTVPRSANSERIAIPQSGVVMSRELARILHVTPGDHVILQTVNGDRRPLRLLVRRIADSYMGLTVYADIHYLSHAVGESFAMNGAQLLTNGNAEDLRNLHHRLKQTPGIQSINSRQKMIENIYKALLESQYIFIGFLVGFAGAIFFGSIVNASIVNLAERQREVATFRALGYGSWRIGGIFLRESLLVNTVGTILGVPVGYGLMVLTARSYDNDLIRLPIVSAAWIWVATFCLSFLFAFMAHGVVQWNIHRLNYLEALNANE